MRPIIITAFLFVAVCVNAQLPYLDKTFGNSGVVFNETMRASNLIMLDNNNEILHVLYAWDFSMFPTRYTSCITKYHTNGSLNNSFGTNGVAFLNHELSGGGIQAIAIFPDNKILIAGELYNQPKESRFFFAKLNSNGTFDSSFGESGIVIANNLSGNYISNVATLENNRFLASSECNIARFNADGTSDNTFGNEGVVSFDDFDNPFHIEPLTVLSDGSILCGGSINLSPSASFEETSSYTDMAIVKMDANGKYDTLFGEGGKLIIDLSERPGMAMPIYPVDHCTHIRELDNSKLMIAVNMENYKNALIKLNADGSFDKTFGNEGVVKHDYGYKSMFVGKETENIYLPCIVWSGSYDVTDSFYLTIFDNTGDVVFDDKVYTPDPVSGARLYLEGANTQPDGKLLLGGSFNNKRLLARLTFDDIISIDDTESNAGFSIYPNPTSEAITISAEEQIKEVSVFNAAGQLLFSQSGNSNTLQISLSYPSGIYNITAITTDGKRYTRKIVKE